MAPFRGVEVPEQRVSEATFVGPHDQVAGDTSPESKLMREKNNTEAPLNETIRPRF